ncbi:hypothetical protein VI817_000376 [Penicillium citrinum]|nr:hypothetical protein VI817_000376 [Penicillium citrinum]
MGDSLAKRQAARGLSSSRSLAARNVFSTIQNSTCALAPETVWGPDGIDGELHRHDVREDQKGIDLYLDIGIIDVETCEPLPDAWLTIWACNATRTNAGFTGIDPDTASPMDGWSTREDGYSVAGIQHLGQLFFEEDLINSRAHHSTLNRTINAEDSLYSSANGNGYSAVVSVSQLGESLSDGLVGYITIGVNTTATPAETTGGSVNVVGALPTVTPSPGAQAAAYALDASEGYYEKKR